MAVFSRCEHDRPANVFCHSAGRLETGGRRLQQAFTERVFAEPPGNMGKPLKMECSGLQTTILTYLKNTDRNSNQNFRE